MRYYFVGYLNYNNFVDCSVVSYIGANEFADKRVELLAELASTLLFLYRQLIAQNIFSFYRSKLVDLQSL